ncbi:ImmA/IrrE family metallo-endopeptidase [Sorangium sp. So ce1036]|uniref:ImmA/IrrE family metallo-endopeptidase n=1 Tax=Sorangium TaxID=39643 RepID=UPI0010110639|nr:ImmA/IrrE family metallo-endopeptidase [Sorangium cellulosum]
MAASREPSWLRPVSLPWAPASVRSPAWTASVDLAHELGHILFDPPQGEIHLVVDQEDDVGKGVRHVEQRARAFAAELLMPAEGLR